MINIYIGYDEREHDAYVACKNSIEQHRGNCVGEVKALKMSDVKGWGLYNRDKIYPDETVSTEFAFTRFLVPYLNKYYGWAMFVDCDFVFTENLDNLFVNTDDVYSVMCVKHEYTPNQKIKMDNQKQTVFPRKNWSSLMLFNCKHGDCIYNLTPQKVNHETPAYLHQMQWTRDSRIGTIDTRWNWLVGEYETPSGFVPSGIHYTNGGPWFDDYKSCDLAEHYWKYHAS